MRTLEAYAALFDPATTETALGEASPHYLMHLPAAGRIAATLPGVRLVAALRDPAERAFSVYQMNLRNHGVNGSVPFLQALEADPNLRRGYAFNLGRFFERFPRERIHIVLFEEIAAAPLRPPAASSASSGWTRASPRTSPRSPTPGGCRGSARCTGS